MFSVSGSTENIPYIFLWSKKYHSNPFSISIHLVFPTYSFSKSNFKVFYENN